MDRRLRALAGSQAGTLSVMEAHAVGVPNADIVRAVRAGELVRVRRGAFIGREVWDAASPDAQFRLSALAIARSRPGDALSHHAALAALDLPLWDHDPDRIDLATRTRRGSSRNGLHLHPIAGIQTQQVAGVRSVSTARAIVRTGLTMGLECAVVAGDAALHQRLVTVADLVAEVALLSPHEGRGRAHEIVLRMDGRAESVGESRTRLVVDALGLAHDSQVELVDDAGRFVARVDLLVEGVVLEFDGRVKYRADMADSADPEAVSRIVWLEKRREDAIRRLGHPVERVVWDDLARPGTIAARVAAARPHVTARQPGTSRQHARPFATGS
ncbi:type IV toxin-antitoxin system AbiEi family antitoxin domain-containing protein [Intrasporangium sp.]|uniref:type IV toxin-antitoxin system AbiEi family antitoxin domain-containing protein n=1 Tax=Intrasporangium sp. TaxID=1925024 RepID=UPI002939F71E|nr:type IV toxin-antitoxin system AbiEi family antitoxin domain-containing protein [Intrasporangium sp.]MDV3222008.1 type IV toxin-antitoxin system AbiEi family antitoxin domain-containing protein [Intrasporangium sp.]